MLVFSYLGICLFESFNKSAPFKTLLHRFIIRLAYFFLSLFIAVGLFTLFTYVRAKALPDWEIYLDYIKSYTIGGFGTLLIEPWSPWIFPVFIYFCSLMIFLFRYFNLKIIKNTGEDKIVLGLTLFGIAQYSYFLGRSHPNNLFHICIPAIIILGYWLIKFFRNKDFPNLLQTTSKAVFYSGVILLVLVSWPSLKTKYLDKNTGLAIISNVKYAGGVAEWVKSEKKLILSGSQDPQVSEAHNLIDQYFPVQKKIPIILSNTNTTEILFTMNRDNIFQISGITEDSISLKNTNRLLALPLPIKEGDYLIIEEEPAAYADINEYSIAIQLLKKICRNFSFQPVENSPHRVSVVRLVPYGNSSDFYCIAITKLGK